MGRMLPPRGTLRLGALLTVALLALAAGVLIGRGNDAPADPGSFPASTVDGTWADLDGNGTLERGPGEPLLERTDLGPAAPAVRTLATLVQITDPHIRDEESPARASLLDRVDPDLNSTFRPQEALSTQVLAGIVASANEVGPDAVLLSGDLVDSAQENEVIQFGATIEGDTVHPDSGGDGYEGPQETSNPDPFFYRPEIDAPRQPGLLEEAQKPFESPGLDAPWHPLAGNHDLLVQGEVAPTPALLDLATGNRLLTGLDDGLEVPEGAGEEALSPELVERVIGDGLPGPTRRVTPDRGRLYPGSAEIIRVLREASGSGGSGPLMDYSFDLGPDVRVIAVDLVNRAGGSGGVVHPGQAEWLQAELGRAGGRHVIVATHQPIESSDGGEELLAVLDEDPGVVAILAGHTHTNSIEPRATSAGGYWEIQTSSLADYPMQARAIRVVETEGGGVALETWMLDATGSDLATTARELAYLDAQGGRPQGNAGEPGDRNAILFR